MEQERKTINEIALGSAKTCGQISTGRPPSDQSRRPEEGKTPQRAEAGQGQRNQNTLSPRALRADSRADGVGALHERVALAVGHQTLVDVCTGRWNGQK